MDFLFFDDYAVSLPICLTLFCFCSVFCQILTGLHHFPYPLAVNLGVPKEMKSERWIFYFAEFEKLKLQLTITLLDESDFIFVPSLFFSSLLSSSFVCFMCAYMYGPMYV